MYAAQLRLPFIFPYFAQLALPRRLHGRASRAANSQAQQAARQAAARATSDRDQLTVMCTSDAFATMLAKAKEPGFDHRAELARLLSSSAKPGESPEDLVASLLQHVTKGLA